MADPIMDEDYIRALLSIPVKVDNSDAIQAGAVQALIDLYDRKVTREEFCQSASACITLYGQCAKFWMLHNIADVFKQGDLDQAKFDKADEAFTALIRKQTETVIEIVKRLQLCPTSQDAVN